MGERVALTSDQLAAMTPRERRSRIAAYGFVLMSLREVVAIQGIPHEMVRALLAPDGYDANAIATLASELHERGVSPDRTFERDVYSAIGGVLQALLGQDPEMDGYSARSELRMVLSWVIYGEVSYPKHSAAVLDLRADELADEMYAVRAV